MWTGRTLLSPLAIALRPNSGIRDGDDDGADGGAVSWCMHLPDVGRKRRRETGALTVAQ